MFNFAHVLHDTQMQFHEIERSLPNFSVGSAVTSTYSRRGVGIAHIRILGCHPIRSQPIPTHHITSHHNTFYPTPQTLTLCTAPRTSRQPTKPQRNAIRYKHIHIRAYPIPRLHTRVNRSIRSHPGPLHSVRLMRNKEATARFDIIVPHLTHARTKVCPHILTT